MRLRQSGEGARANDKMGEVQKLALAIGAAGRSPSSSSLLGVVTPGRSGTAAQRSGRASWRSSPWATALTPSVRMGRAVHRGEVNCCTARAVALVGARSPSPWSSSSSRARACGRCARLSSGRPRRREARSWGGLRRLNRGLSRFREASVQRRRECAELDAMPKRRRYTVRRRLSRSPTAAQAQPRTREHGMSREPVDGEAVTGDAVERGEADDERSVGDRARTARRCGCWCWRPGAPNCAHDPRREAREKRPVP